jgi:hypothetical protein
MASSYSTDLKLELMVTGENAGTWGDKTNSNLNLVQQAIAGYEAVTITDSTTTALVMSNAALSNARNMVIKIATITLTGATTVTIPNGIEKFYIFDLTAVTGVTNLTIKTASGTGFTAGEAKIVAAYSDGTDLKEIALDTLGGTIGTAQIADNAITSAKISANQVTTAKISDNAITTAKISALQVTADKIANSTITQAKLASNSVGPDQLISTSVTAGSYTVASITVDADGRITAASSGSAGAPSFKVALTAGSGDTGTYTANPAANVIRVYYVGGAGGVTPSSPNSPNDQGAGHAGYGFFTTTITHPYAVPYSVGTNGNNTPGNPTTFSNLTASAGLGAYAGPNFVNPTSAPGATVDLSPSAAPTGNALGYTFPPGMKNARAGTGGSTGNSTQNPYRRDPIATTFINATGGALMVEENTGP